MAGRNLKGQDYINSVVFSTIELFIPLAKRLEKVYII